MKPESLKGFKFQDSKSFFKNLNRKVNLHVSFASIYNLKKEETILLVKKNKLKFSNYNFKYVYISKSSSNKKEQLLCMEHLLTQTLS